MSNKNEDIFSGIPFGKWNLLYIAIACLQQATCPAQYFSSIFLDMAIDFRCTDNTTRSSNSTFDNTCFQNVAIIGNEEYTKSKYKCSNYEFDTAKVSSTFTSEFQLVCDKEWLSAIYKIILPIGSCIGSLFIGTSDKWGRVTIIRISSSIQAVGGLMVGLAMHEFLVLSGRFLIGLTIPILSSSAMVLVNETIQPNLRSTVGFLVVVPFYVGLLLLGGLAYFIREWRVLYLITSSPMYIIPFIALFLDKSPRWLIQKGRVDEAQIVLQNAGKMNSGTVNVDLTAIEIETNSESNSHSDSWNFISESFDSAKKLTKQLYGTTAMLKFSFFIPMLWFLSGFVYFGVPLNANNFTDNPYLYIIMIGAAECPAAFLGPLIIKCFGNIKTGMSFFLITGICMLGTLLVPDSLWWMKWVFALLSMTCSGAIITIAVLLVSELFPTVLRSTGYGISNLAYFAAFFLSSFINSELFPQTWWTFNALCGTCCVIAAALISTLPDTQGQKLCETTDQVNDRDKNIVNKI